MRRCVAVVAALLIATQVATGAIERKPLPPFGLSNAEGGRVESGQIVGPGRWLILYVKVDCAPCDAVLRSVRFDRDPLLPDHITIVVSSAKPSELSAVSHRFPDLARATWLADPDGAMAQAIHLPGVPVVLGLAEHRLEWSLAGIPRTSADVLSAMRSWVNER